jgi:hypothetical protein
MVLVRYYEHVNRYNSQVAETVKRTRNNLGKWPHGSGEDDYIARITIPPSYDATAQRSLQNPEPRPCGIWAWR